MAIKPPKQFCGEEHWSGEDCKECGSIKTPIRTTIPPLKRFTGQPVPLCRCSEYKAAIQDLTLQVAALQAQVEEYNTKAERERQATLERVRQYRARKSGAVE